MGSPGDKNTDASNFNGREILGSPPEMWGGERKQRVYSRAGHHFGHLGLNPRGDLYRARLSVIPPEGHKLQYLPPSFQQT